MIQKRMADLSGQECILTAEEQAILKELQQLFAAGVEEIPLELVERMKQQLRWSLDDAASLRRALSFASQDPYYHREIQEVNAEFAKGDQPKEPGT